MPPCIDIHVWGPERDSEVLGRFIDSYVNVAASDERLHAFMRVQVLGIANDTDDKGCHRNTAETGRTPCFAAYAGGVSD
jgi:hypothetical protein